MTSERKLSQKQREVLRKNQFTSEQSRDAAARNGSKGGINSAKAKNMRKLATRMLQSVPDVPENTLKSLKQLGVDADKPDMQTIILGKIFALTMSKDPKVAMQATQMVLEITGNDVRSLIAAERNALERERIKLERERVKNDNDSNSESEYVNIVITPSGGIEVNDG